MALTAADDPGLVVLPTHRLVSPRHMPPDADQRIARGLTCGTWAPCRSIARWLRSRRDRAVVPDGGPGPSSLRLLTLRDRTGVEALMPDEQSAAWKRLDVNVLQYGILLDVFGIDDAALAAGGAVSYIQDAADARNAVAGVLPTRRSC